MRADQKVTLALSIALITVVGISFLYLPSRIDALRGEMEAKIASGTERARGPAKDMIATSSGNLDAIQARVDELGKKLEGLPTTERVEELRRAVNALQDELAKKDKAITDLAWKVQVIERGSTTQVAPPSGSEVVAQAPQVTGGVSQPAAAQPRSAAPKLSTTQDDWRFEVQSVVLQEERLLVTLLLTNLIEDREFDLSPVTRAFNQNGRELKLVMGDKVRIAGDTQKFRTAYPISHHFIKGVATEMVIEFSKVDASTTELVSLEIMEWREKPIAKFRNVPVVHQ